jgi:hypothetical protein
MRDLRYDDADGSEEITDAPTSVDSIDAPPDTPLGGRDGSALDGGPDQAGLGGAGGAGGTGRGGSGGSSSAGGAGGTSAGGTGGNAALDGGSACVGRPPADAGRGINEGLVAHYPCDETSGSTLADQSGKSNNATLTTNSSGGYSFVTGKVGTNALELVGAKKGYATLPSGLLTDACDVTVASWVYLTTSQNWQRLFDFGRDTKVYMFLTAKNDATNVVRFAISTSGNGAGEQFVDGATELSMNAWSHVAIVLGASGATLYVNGIAVGTNANITLRPADLGTPLNYYIGRSQFSSDPYFNGRIDDFRIYDRTLSASEIQALAAM